jgi:hypothetical protein
LQCASLKGQLGRFHYLHHVGHLRLDTVAGNRVARTILLSFTLPVFIAFIKFRTVAGYHTWSVRLAVTATIIGYILLFNDLLDWPFKIVTLLCLYAAAEEIAITLLIRHEQTDIKTVYKALKLRVKA